MGWTPELIKDLKRLWSKGLTTVEIGNRIGMSKNAVVGKAHRLGLEGRPSPIKREKKKEHAVLPKAHVREDVPAIATTSAPVPKKSAIKKEASVKSKILPEEVEPALEDGPVFEMEPLPEMSVPRSSKKHKGVHLVDLKPNSCRWPEGDPKDADFRFCGEECVAGKIYCEEHCAVAYSGVFKAR